MTTKLSKPKTSFKIQQVYVRYQEWEDWQSGMWRSLPAEEEATMLSNAILFTGNHILYGEAMQQVVSLWPRTILNALTNPSINQRAFLGHCACQWKIDCPEYITRIAWKHLTDIQRKEADAVAQKTIDEWKTNYILKLKEYESI